MEVKIGSHSKKTAAILTMYDDQRMFLGNRENFIDIIQTGRTRGIEIYVITTKDLQLHKHQVLAYRYIPESQMWITEWIPIPRIIYNRIPLRKHELQPEVHKLLKQLINHRYIRFYNPYFFNKWTLFEWLKKSKSTKRYIPATVRFKKTMKLAPLLNRFSILYLKPEKGKAGAGIMRIEKVQTKHKPYHLMVQSKKQCKTLAYSKLPRLKSKVSKLVQDKPYIVQQGITLSSSRKRPFDLRVLMQKNDKGRWSLTGVGARVAGQSSITTHVPRGGSIDDPIKLLVSSFGTVQGKKIYSKARNAAYLIVRQIEKECGYTLGEMSMDLGVDTQGNVWFFEANAKPMKFDEPDIREKSLQQTINFIKYLTK